MKQSKFKQVMLDIEGMTCTGCETRIENVLRKLGGVIAVTASFNKSSAAVTWDPGRIEPEVIKNSIEKLDYRVSRMTFIGEDGHAQIPVEMEETAKESGTGAESEKEINRAEADKPNAAIQKKAAKIVGTGVMIAALYLMISQTRGFSFVPEINQSMGYGILFLVGLLTSLHCVAMCGGINLSVCMQYKAVNEDTRYGKLIPTALYNLGRVISYTVIGGIVGAVGSVITLPGRAKGIVALISGIFMLIMGLNMMDIFPALRKLNPRLPKFLGQSVHESSSKKGPFVVGMLNGLMPCGPLQAMQLYALGTGSFAAGALSMFLFSMGTVPLMFGFGALSSVLKGKFTHKMMKVSSVLVIVLGLVMLNRGLNLSGLGVTVASAATGANNIASVKNGVQTVSIDLEPGSYSPIVVQKGIPVKWTIRVDKGDLNGCNNPVTIPQLGIQKKLTTGDNVIEFTAEEEGDLIYTCWMGMISSRIRVVSDLGSVSEEEPSELAASDLRNIGGLAVVPTDTVAVAEIRDGVQYVEMDVNENEYSPAVIVLQEDIKTVWKINGTQLNDHNSQIVFPVFGVGFDVEEGENEIEFVPEFDFDFQCPQGRMVGHVKVVKDINSVDIPAIQRELKGYRPAPAVSGASCH